MRCLVVIGVAVLTALISTRVQAQELTGSWDGTVTQYGPGTHRGTYEAKMALDGKTGTIDYPSLGCGGKLVFIELRGSAYAYRERLSYGIDRCVNYGLVTVVRTEGGLQWEWTMDIVGKAVLKPSR